MCFPDTNKTIHNLQITQIYVCKQKNVITQRSLSSNRLTALLPLTELVVYRCSDVISDELHARRKRRKHSVLFLCIYYLFNIIFLFRMQYESFTFYLPRSLEYPMIKFSNGIDVWFFFLEFFYEIFDRMRFIDLKNVSQ